jgi:hypothetical protein
VVQLGLDAARDVVDASGRWLGPPPEADDNSVGYGTSWTASNGVPANAIVAADRVNPMTFYAYSNGTFHVSTNGGASFTATAAAGLPAWSLQRWAASRVTTRMARAG